MRSFRGRHAVVCQVFIGALGAISGSKKGNVSRFIAEGNEHYRRGELAKAINAYNQALDLDPKNPDAWNNKGLILAVAGNYREALKCHLKAVELDPENIDAVSNVGMIHTKLQNSKDALIWYDKALAMDKTHETTWNNKGNLLSKLGRYDDALKCYDRALEINPNYMAAMNNKAVELIHLKNYDEALELLNNVLKSRPMFSEGWYVKGKAYVGMGEFDKAIICLERSHRLNPDFHQAKRALDVLKNKLVQPPGSKVKGTGKKTSPTQSEMEKMERSIKKEILKPRTETEMISDEFKRPEEHLTKEERVLLDIVTDDFQPASALKSVAGNALSKPALDRALEGLERKGLIMSRLTGNVKEYAMTRSLGTIEQQLVEQKEEQEPEDMGNDLHALVSRSRKFMESGRYADASSTLRKALKINPYDEMAVCLLAQVQFEMGDRDRAINTISKILASKPNHVPAWFILANASLKAKQYADAADCYRKILELQPENAEAKKGLEASEAELKS